MAEQLQQLILDTIDAQSTLADSRTLTIPGQSSQATSHDAQITILGALNSLLSREASVLLFLSRSCTE
jgi:phenylalanyl-tRNA synthetase alpha chain